DRWRMRRLAWCRDWARGIVAGRRRRSPAGNPPGAGAGRGAPPVVRTGLDAGGGAPRRDLARNQPGGIPGRIAPAAKAHGLELRAPFLDVELAEFCIALPTRLKIRPGQDKVLLRAAYSRDWPGPIRQRTKQGFGAPMQSWLSHPTVAPLVQEHLI